MAVLTPDVLPLDPNPASSGISKGLPDVDRLVLRSSSVSVYV